MARENPAYVRIGGDECGRYDLAGKSIAAPFVGAIAVVVATCPAPTISCSGCVYSRI